MTLHAAIQKLLRQTGGSMTTQEIAQELTKNNWYKKKNDSKIQTFQIHGRIKNYPHIFERHGSTVSLIKQPKASSKLTITEKTNFSKQQKEITSAKTKTSFNPISNSDATVLILGTMPGDKSLELGEYYAHPRNRFWKIISTITGNDLPLNYSEKKQLLLKTKIGIWDVAHKANRKGSLDISIKNEKPNDLNDFISKHKNLKVIGFNGIKSEKLYDKYFDRKDKIIYISLPSTSPANTSIDFDTICKVWKTIFET